MTESTELTAALLLAAALLLNALDVSVRWQPTRQTRSCDAPNTPAQRARGIAWGGTACAMVAIIGFIAAPGVDLVWFVLIAVAIVSVPVAAVASNTNRAAGAGSPSSSDEEDEHD